MEQRAFGGEKKTFNNPEEELQFLRKEVIRRETESVKYGRSVPREEIVSRAIKEYGEEFPNKVLNHDYALKKIEKDAIVLNLAPEPHDRKIEELIAILEKKGIKNTLGVIQKLSDAHIDDDFHRFLIQYVKAGFSVKGLKPKTSLGKSLHSTLYEVTLPELSLEEGKVELEKLISGMEQFYAGMLSISDSHKTGERSFAIEIANANCSDEFIFYVSVPDDKRPLF